MFERGILREGDWVELREGVIVTEPLPNPPHAAAIDLANGELPPLLPNGWYVRSQSPVATPDSVCAPDLAVVRGPRRRYADRHPGPRDIALVIEVAQSTLRQDREVMGRIYARAGIPIYWIVNLVKRQIEVYTDATGDTNEPRYRKRHDFGVRSSVSVVIAGRQCGRIGVRNLIPE